MIYQATHNAFLAEQATQLQRRLRPFRRLQLRIRNRVGTSFSEHEGIVAAIVGGDGDTAARLLRDHVIVQGERYGDLVASIGHVKSAASSTAPVDARRKPARRATRKKK